MRKLFREYNRLKKLVRMMEGKIRPEMVENFLEEVDEEAFTRLQVKAEDRKKLKEAEAEQKLSILSPYLEKYLKQVVEGRFQEKLGLAEEVAEKIAQEARHHSGRIELPFQTLRLLGQLNPAVFIGLENGEQAFIFPMPKFRQILASLDQAKVVWDTRKNFLKIYTVESRSKFAFTLFSQDPNLAQEKGSFLIKLSPPSPGFSLTEILYKTAESVLSL